MQQMSSRPAEDRMPARKSDPRTLFISPLSHPQAGDPEVAKPLRDTKVTWPEAEWEDPGMHSRFDRVKKKHSGEEQAFCFSISGGPEGYQNVPPPNLSLFAGLF